MSKHVITTIVVAVVIGVVGFFGGMKYGEGKAKAATPTAATGAAGFAGRAGRGAGGTFGGGSAAAGSGLVTGQIIKQDSSSITVQLAGTAGTKLVLFSPDITVGRIATGTVSDLTTGENVVVTGTANSDGSVSATSIQVRPAGMGGFGGQASSTPSGSNAPMIPYQPAQ